MKPVGSKTDVLNQLKSHQAEIHGFGVARIGLFGSVLHGSAEESSDIDFLVDFRPELKTFDNFMHLSFYLEELFDRKIDLVTRESLSPYIGPHILRDIEYVEITS